MTSRHLDNVVEQNQQKKIDEYAELQVPTQELETRITNALHTIESLDVGATSQLKKRYVAFESRKNNVHRYAIPTCINSTSVSYITPIRLLLSKRRSIRIDIHWVDNVSALSTIPGYSRLMTHLIYLTLLDLNRTER